MLWTLFLSAAVMAGTSLDGPLRAVAAVRGEPSIMSAAGLTKDEAPILTLENATAFDRASSRLRLLVVGGRPARRVGRARVRAMVQHRGKPAAAAAVGGQCAAWAQFEAATDGIFIHAIEVPFAWGRGNGFAALGLMEALEALSALPEQDPARSRLVEIFRRQMAGVKAQQAPDGMWREVIDEPGAYREETATAMLMTAMARGIRRGWIDRAYLPVVQRAWRALAAHVREDGTLVDVCASTGAGPTRRYYLDRPAITGADDRGGAMALLAATEIYELSRNFPAVAAQRVHELHGTLDQLGRLDDVLDRLRAIGPRDDHTIVVVTPASHDFVAEALAVSIEEPDHPIARIQQPLRDRSCVFGYHVASVRSLTFVSDRGTEIRSSKLLSENCSAEKSGFFVQDHLHRHCLQQ